MNLRRYLLATLAAIALAPAAASAAEGDAKLAGELMLAGLVGDRTLVIIDANEPRAMRRVTVRGGGRLLSIDVRPANGQLYGVDSNGSVFIINPANGNTTARQQLQDRPPASTRVNIDFNPVVDRLRIIGEDGTNLRANVDDGTVTRDPNLNFLPPMTGTPNAVAAAYTNNFPGTTATLLYDITARDLVFLQLPANNGTLNPVGPLGVDVGQFGFDIQTRNQRNRGLLVSGNDLYDVDLGGGRAFNRTAIRNLQGDVVRDLAVLNQGG